MNFLNDDKIKYYNKFIVKLLKEYNIYNNNTSLLEIRKLICYLIKKDNYDDLKAVFDILFECDVNSILLLLLHYKNKTEISKKEIEKIIHKKIKSNLYINFNIKENWLDTIFHPHSFGSISPLLIAYFYNYVKIIELLINYGADINIKNINHENLLICLSYGGLDNYIKSVKSLIKNNIDIYSKDKDGNTALHIICTKYNGYEKCHLEYLLNQGLNANERNNKGNTPLMELSYHSVIDIGIPVLINYGANVNLVNNKGESSFLIACKKGKYKIASRLYEYGANPFIKDNDNNSAIRIFIKNECAFDNDAYYGEIGFLNFLLEIGFDINETDKDGVSLLMEACYLADASIFLHLLRKGANLYIKDNNGNTALSIAKSSNNYYIKQFLIDHGYFWKFCNYSKNKK